MKPTALIHGRVVLPHRVIEDGAVLIDQGRIAAVAATENITDICMGWQQIDVEKRLITPGLMDIHIHGARGHTFNEPTLAA